MASSSRAMGSGAHQFNDVEMVRSSFKPNRLPGSHSDSALMGRRSSPNPQAMRDYSMTTSWVNGREPRDYPLTRRHPASSNRSREDPTLSEFSDCRAGVGVDQVNGIVVVCGPEAVEYDLEAPDGTYIYRDCVKEGAGTQINGLDVVYYGVNTRVPKYPGMNGHWHRPEMVPANGQKEVKGSKNQINGGRIRRMGREEEEMARLRQFLR